MLRSIFKMRKKLLKNYCYYRKQKTKKKKIANLKAELYTRMKGNEKISREKIKCIVPFKL